MQRVFLTMVLAASTALLLSSCSDTPTSRVVTYHFPRGYRGMWFVIADLKTGSNGGFDNLTFGDDGICHVTQEQFDSLCDHWLREVAIVDGHTVRQIDGALNVESSETVFWGGGIEYAGAVDRATGIKFYMYGFVGNKDDLDRSGFVWGHASDVLLKKLGRGES